jgi:hypothetical protein
MRNSRCARICWRGWIVIERQMPPLAHVRKAVARLDRLEEAALTVHSAIDPRDPGRMPPKRDRQDYIERYELVIRDYRRILEDLGG